MKSHVGKYTYTEDEKIILNNASCTWNVDDIVKLHFFDKIIDFRVVHKNYFTKEKVVLMPTEILCLAPFDMEGNGYVNSYLRKFVNTSVLSGFLPEIQKAMTKCDIECWDEDDTSIIVSDKIFVPSVTEHGLLKKGNECIPAKFERFDCFTIDESRELDIDFYIERYWTRAKCSDDLACSIDCYGCRRDNNMIDILGVVFAFEV